MTTLTRITIIPVILIMCLCSATLSAKNTLPASLVKIIKADTATTPEGPDTATKHYLALGDSYTIGQSVKPTERYPVQIVTQLRNAGYNIADAEIIATSGWTTGNLLEAVKEKPFTPVYDMVTLLIGVNNQYRGLPMEEYRIEFTALLKKAIAFAGNKPERVIVLSIPDYSVTPFANNSDRQAIARQINSFNQVNKRVSEIRGVHYLNVTNESRKAAWDHSLIAYDDLHFSGKEYSIWTSMLVPMISEVLKNNPGMVQAKK